MAEYWPRYFFAFLWTSKNVKKKELGQYPVIMQNNKYLHSILVLKGPPVSHGFSSQYIFFSQTRSGIYSAESYEKLHLFSYRLFQQQFFSAQKKRKEN